MGMRYHYLITIFLIVCSIGVNARQNQCSQVAEKRKEIDAKNERLKEVTGELKRGYFSLDKRKKLADEEKSLVEQIRLASKTAAALLEECLTQHPDPEADLFRKYQIAKYYINADDCRNAYSYIQQCNTHARLGSDRIGDKPIRECVSMLDKHCTRMNTLQKEECSRIIWRGKGLYFPLKRVDNTDNRPYTGDELEILSGRQVPAERVDSSLAPFKQLSDSQTAYYHFPFVLVQGPGKYHYTAIKSEKTAPVKRHDLLNEGGIERSDIPLEYIYKQIIAPYYGYMKSTYFDSLRFDYVLPIYLAGGNFEQGSYDAFSKFCEKVHLRSPGPTVAYYSPVDRSIMAWMPTGGGTLIHELVHALMDNDCKKNAGWLSEGIASLYEEVDNITYQPKDNYRIYYIKRFRDEKLCHLSIEKLISLKSFDLSDPETGMLYSAYARYLAKYLFEMGVLPKYYKTFRDSENDHLAALKLVLNKDAPNIQMDWERWLESIPLPEKWESLTPSISHYIYKNAVHWSCK